MQRIVMVIATVRIPILGASKMIIVDRGAGESTVVIVRHIHAGIDVISHIVVGLESAVVGTVGYVDNGRRRIMDDIVVNLPCACSSGRECLDSAYVSRWLRSS